MMNKKAEECSRRFFEHIFWAEGSLETSIAITIIRKRQGESEASKIWRIALKSKSHLRDNTHETFDLQTSFWERYEIIEETTYQDR